MKNICIFASGSGSNAENISKYFRGSGTASVSLILTENPNAYVLERAKNLNIPGMLFTMEQLRNGSVLRLLSERSIHFVVLAGFLKLIPGAIIDAYPNRIVNIHPPAPQVRGEVMYFDVFTRPLSRGRGESGITIHT
jgi:phosphoribosylglycinamide formyltransferase-1